MSLNCGRKLWLLLKSLADTGTSNLGPRTVLKTVLIFLVWKGLHTPSADQYCANRAPGKNGNMLIDVLLVKLKI